MNFINKISNILNINVEAYISDVIYFYNNYNNLILQYYTIVSASYPQEAFNYYYDIVSRTDKILEKVHFYKELINNIGYWDLLENIDSIKQRLELINSYGRFSKAGFVKNKDKEGIETESYITKQNESIENIADQQNSESWDSIAIFNNLKEEDYTLRGGTNIVLKSSGQLPSSEASLNSVVDLAIGENLLGKDLPNYVEFNKEGEDLIVDTPKQTNLHTAQRLLSLKKGSFPEFPTIGIQKDIITESVKGEGFMFPILMRQLAENFSTDDTIVNFTITDIVKDEDNLIIKASFSNLLEDNLYLESKL